MAERMFSIRRSQWEVVNLLIIGFICDSFKNVRIYPDGNWENGPKIETPGISNSFENIKASSVARPVDLLTMATLASLTLVWSAATVTFPKPQEGV